MIEHIDFTHSIKISTKVEFESTIDNYTGLSNIEIKIKKKIEKPLKIENVSRRNTKKGLF